MDGFDPASYVEDVVLPIQTGWPPRSNYFRVYQLPLHPTPSQVDSALADMPTRWGMPELRQHALACDRLHACHAEAAAVLGNPARRARHREAIEREHRALGEVVIYRLHGALAMTPAEVAALVRDVGGRWSRPDVVVALSAVGAAVREPAALPPVAQPKLWPRLRESLADLPHRTLWEYLARTPELGGTGTSAAHVETRRQQLRVVRDRAADAEQAVLALVRRWLDEPGLAAVLAYELMADLSAAALCGYPAVRRLADPDRCAAAGLPPDPDVVAYAAWAARADFGVPPWADAYNAAIAEHRLPEALALLAAHPLPEPWRNVRDDLRATVARLTTDLARARELEGSAPEDAAAVYLAVGREMADPAVAAGLKSCPAAAPAAVNATVNGDTVVVVWKPSASTAGRVGYRVCRGATVLAEEISALTFTDHDAPVGPELVYTVTALREGEPGESAGSEVVTVRPEVADLRVSAEPGVVLGWWRLPAGAVGASVTRIGPEGAIMDVTASGTGFVDRKAAPWSAYTYQVQAEYPAPAGGHARSRGLDLPVVCPGEPDGVTDLRAVAAGDAVDLVWTPPRWSLVEIRVLDRPEVPPPGMVRLDQADAAGPVVVTSRTGRARVAAAELAGGRMLVPVTVSGQVAAIGPAAVLDITLEPVADLRAVRFGPLVQLLWRWPFWAHDALVVWRYGAPLAGPTDPAASRLRTTRTAHLSRGVWVRADVPGNHWFGVCVADRDNVCPLATVQSFCPAEARYHVRRRVWSRTRAVRVESDIRLPNVAVFAQAGRRPLAHGDGILLTELPGGALTSQAEFAVPAKMRRPVHLRAFTLDESVWLRHPDPRELVVR
jgi:hypothetical protein